MANFMGLGDRGSAIIYEHYFDNGYVSTTSERKYNQRHYNSYDVRL